MTVTIIVWLAGRLSVWFHWEGLDTAHLAWVLAGSGGHGEGELSVCFFIIVKVFVYVTDA